MRNSRYEAGAEGKSDRRERAVVVLSEKEQRALVGIERYLRDTDPRFARRMRGGSPAGVARTRAGCTVVAVVSGLTALLCLTLSLVASAAVAALLTAAALCARPR
jgi:hypothetical protein